MLLSINSFRESKHPWISPIAKSCFMLAAFCALAKVALFYKFWFVRQPVRFANVCNVRGLPQLTRPKKSLHFLLVNPDSNLHIFFNPKCSLLFLNPSLWSGA